jgi:alkylation response protein AidB-like acyl-CoA dehydrogenase
LVANDGEVPALFLLPVQGEAVKKLSPSGWRAAAWGHAEFDRVVVPSAQVLTRGDQAGAAIAEVQSWYNVSMAARALGVARAAIAQARAYGADRIQFGQPIGTFEALRQICDDNETLIEAAWLLTRKAAWQIDRGQAEARDNASRARNLAAQVVSRATIDAVQVHGGYGFVNDFPVEKLMRDAPAYAVLGGDEGFARQSSGGRGGN